MRHAKTKKLSAAAQLEGEVLSTLRDSDDDDGLVQRSFGITIRAIDKEKRSVEVVASTDSIDAYDEIVDQSWDLTRYDANPVVLWNHNRSSYGGDPEDCLPIGFATNVSANGRLLATLNFVDENANPLAERIWQGFLQGSIRAVSVGFDPKNISIEKRDDVDYYRLSNNELFEISVCPMGANPDAVAKSRTKAVAQIKAKMASRTKTIIEPQLEEKSIPVPSTPDKEDTNMTTEEQRALEAKNAELQAKLNLSTESAAKLEADSKVLSAKVVELEKTLESERAKSVTLNERCATLETERAAQQKRANELQAKSVERDLDELVGTKIAPAEKPGLIKLAALDEALYTEQLTAIKARPDMKMLGAPVIGKDPSPPASSEAPAATDDSGDELTRAVTKRLEAPARTN